jgi:hypothetical protein
VFVQDFVRVDRPLEAAIAGFERAVVPHLGALVRDAWIAESDGVAPVASTLLVPTDVGPRRQRSDGVVYALSWPADPGLWLPEFDADLELAALSASRTHLELSGQSRFPTVEAWSEADRRANRRGMAAIAGLLVSIASVIETAEISGAVVPSRSGPAT